MHQKVKSPTYDYIICGVGCAGLSLVMHMIASGRFGNEQILIVDKDAKNQNDRTWCFWEKEAGLFDPIVYKSWDQFWLHSVDSSKCLSIAPYQYKLIRGIDFYTYCLTEISRQPNIRFIQGEIDETVSNGAEASILINGEQLSGRFVFNSLFKEKPKLKPHHYWLLQHFRGWLVESEEAIFDPSSATFMDFRTDQSRGTSFFYVLPFDEKRALIEYTLFSTKLLPGDEYEAALKIYVEGLLGIKNYRINDTETGVIPMTNYPFTTRQGNIVHIGTAGGQTKASSGFTFQFIQKHSKAIVESLIKCGTPFLVSPQSSRFLFYDSVLLRILEHQTLPGAEIFTTLFDRNAPASVLKFLDNETSLAEELPMISTLPTWPFLRAALRHWGVCFGNDFLV